MPWGRPPHQSRQP